MHLIFVCLIDVNQGDSMTNTHSVPQHQNLNAWLTWWVRESQSWSSQIVLSLFIQTCRDSHIAMTAHAIPGLPHLCLKINHSVFDHFIWHKMCRAGKGASATCPPDSGTLAGTLRFTRPTCSFFKRTCGSPGGIA